MCKTGLFRDAHYSATKRIQEPIATPLTVWSVGLPSPFFARNMGVPSIAGCLSQSAIESMLTCTGLLFRHVANLIFFASFPIRPEKDLSIITAVLI